MPITKQSVTLTFQDPSGAPIANGSVTFRLQQDISTATSGGPQITAGKLVMATLNSSGSATVLLWPTSMMQPSAVYFVTAYTASGLSVWQSTLSV